MVHHIVLWNFKQELTASEKKSAALQMKERLEGVKEQVSGVISLQVIINEFSSSNKEIALISCFESTEALNEYQLHPAHVRAGEFVKSVACDRVCIDYEA